MIDVVDVERNVLAIALQHSQTLEPLLAEVGLRPKHFILEGHAALFSAMTDLFDAGSTVTDITVREAMGRTGTLELLGGGGGIDLLLGPISNFAGWKEHAAIVIDKARWRARKQATLAALHAVESEDEAAFNRYQAINDDEAADDSSSADPEALADEFTAWYESTDQAAIPLPFSRLTNVLRGGLRPGDTTVLAGWTSVGKSTLADQLLEHAHRHGAKGWVYMNEMSRVDRACRLLASRSGVAFDRIITKKLNPDELRMVLHEAPRLPFGMTVCAGWSALDIARHIRRLRVDIAVVDLVTRIPAQTVAEWDEVSGTLTDAARPSGTHLILVSQLNQERLKTTHRPAPVLRDLRNTGAWAADARNVIFIHRDDVDVEGGITEPGLEGHVRVAKASNGELGAVQVILNPRLMRFEQMAHLEAVA